MKKRDVFANKMNGTQVAAGRELWQGKLRKKAVQGDAVLAKSSFNAEEQAPKTWILYLSPKGDEIATIECELYSVPRLSDANEAVVMLHGMCPNCGETFLAREDNKSISIDYVPFRKAPKFLRINWKWHCDNALGRRVSDSDKIPVISSPERWQCDYCKGWCVRVNGGVAKDDFKGATIVSIPARARATESAE